MALGQPQVMEIQIFDEAFKDYVGRVAYDVGLLEKEQTHKRTLKLQEGSGEIILLITISGTSGIESNSDLVTYNPSEDDVKEIQSRFVSP